MNKDTICNAVAKIMEAQAILSRLAARTLVTAGDVETISLLIASVYSLDKIIQTFDDYMAKGAERDEQDTTQRAGETRREG